MSTYSYRTDAVHCDGPFTSEAAAVMAAVNDRDWAPVGSEQESRDIDGGAWLTVYEDRIPVMTRGMMP